MKRAIPKKNKPTSITIKYTLIERPGLTRSLRKRNEPCHFIVDTAREIVTQLNNIEDDTIIIYITSIELTPIQSLTIINLCVSLCKIYDIKPDNIYSSTNKSDTNKVIN